jgi:biotin carboxylase
MSALGLVRGVTHTEFIRGRDDGRFYFLETASRVGGANIAETIEAATGVNLWAEWARIEINRGERPYTLDPPRNDYAGIIISLARQEHPDTSAYDDPEIVWRMKKRHHAGLIVASSDPARVERLLEDYSRRFYEDFFATQPLPDRPTS